MKSNNEVVTKTDLLILEQNMDVKLDGIDEKNRGYRDQILTALDKVVKELELWREDKVLSDHQLENHEERLVKLESSVH